MALAPHSWRFSGILSALLCTVPIATLAQWMPSNGPSPARATALLADG